MERLSGVNGGPEVTCALVEVGDTPPRTFAPARLPRGSIINTVAGLAIDDYHVDVATIFGGSHHEVPYALFVAGKIVPHCLWPTMQPRIDPWLSGAKGNLAAPQGYANAACVHCTPVLPRVFETIP
ncbi:hypothetical protein [Microvirga subterranea]|uniref:hypothetical protein n=1 Tax=Microvirga subterranea TaxID=186651 RepID=UPI0011C02569|nr:hypothetical protein [Microvirga subterranea]